MKNMRIHSKEKNGVFAIHNVREDLPEIGQTYFYDVWFQSLNITE